MSPVSASVAAGMTVPIPVPGAVFSATLRINVVSANTGLLLGVTAPAPVTAMSKDRPLEACLQGGEPPCG